MPPSLWAAFFVVLIAGCASAPTKVPYPAFIQADTLQDVFLASLPGVRAKQFSGDAQTRRSSNRVDLPPGWQGTSGASPGKTLELFVLAGKVDAGDITLSPGGYLYAPAGNIGFNLRTTDGARVLYYIDDVDPATMIRTPILLDSQLVDWQPTDTAGVQIKELRSDPGSGARIWLEHVAPGAVLPWRASSAIREGYLAAGQFQQSECVNGDVRTGVYQPGGYFYRPAGAYSGGPKAKALTDSLWVLRERTTGTVTTADACRPALNEAP
jgi:Domain of unknown function (DUF4437)